MCFTNFPNGLCGSLISLDFSYYLDKFTNDISLFLTGKKKKILLVIWSFLFTVGNHAEEK